MKIIQLIFFIVLLCYHAIGQNVEALERKLSSKGLSTNDSIEILNTVSRDLTFVNRIKALDYANKALELSLRTNYSTGAAYAYRNLSSLYSFNDSYFISMDYLQRALEIFTLNNDTIGMANCYIILGHTYRQLQNRDEEIEYHLKAYEIFKKLNNNIERIGVTAHNLGESYFNVGDLAKSRQLTLYALNINDSIGNKPLISACNKVMGMIELEENNLSAAENYFKKNIELANQMGETSQKNATAESMIQLATVYKLMGDFDKQLQFLLAASEFSTKNILQSHLQRSYQELILYSSEKNDLASVKKYITSFRTVSDSLTQRQLRDRYSLTKSLEDLHKLAKSNAKLEKVNLLQSEKIKNRNTILLIIIISSLILLLLLLKFKQLNSRLKAKTSLIELQKKELEVLNGTKDKFFSIVAHDLKSPLISLQSYSTVLINYFDDFSKDEILSMSRNLKSSVENTIKMADNLITWAMVQMNEYQYNQESINVKDVIENILAVYKGVAEEKGLDVSYAVEDSLTIVGDKNQIEFTIRNLVNNAVKYTKKGGSVSVLAQSSDDSTVDISISDNGIGMTSEITEKLFSIHKKHSREGTNGEKGTGLGLMLSYEFVKLNGGEISVKSSQETGTTFHIKYKSGN
jgi:signal transduction histidine kinase